MKYQIIFFLVVSVLFSVWSVCHAAPAYSKDTPVMVKEYTKKDGTVVKKYYRAKHAKVVKSEAKAEEKQVKEPAKPAKKKKQ